MGNFSILLQDEESPMEMGIFFQQTIVLLAQQNSGSSLPVPTEPGSPGAQVNPLHASKTSGTCHKLCLQCRSV